MSCDRLARVISEGAWSLWGLGPEGAPGDAGTERDPHTAAIRPSVGVMSDQEAARRALREYLTTRRERITPSDAGLPAFGGRRRVKGLRREEVAMLAGISPEYYTRLERGAATGISPEIVDSVATALRLDGDERVHLDRLVSALTPAARRKRRATKPGSVSPGVQVMLDALQDLPAVVFNAHLDIVAINDLGRALYSSHYIGAGAAQRRPLPVPRRGPGPPVLARMGKARRRRRGDPAGAGRAQPRGPRAGRARRSAVHPK